MSLILPERLRTSEDRNLAANIRLLSVQLVEHHRDANPYFGGPDPLAPMSVIVTVSPVKIRGDGTGAYESVLDIVNFDALRELRVERKMR